MPYTMSTSPSVHTCSCSILWFKVLQLKGHCSLPLFYSQIRIVVGNDDPEVARLDGGAFLEWLQRQDDEAEQGTSSGTIPSFQPRVAVIGHNFKPIPAILEAPELSSLAKPAARRDAAIATPSYINIQSSSAQGTACV